MTDQPPAETPQRSSGCLLASLGVGCGCLLITVAVIVAGVTWLPDVVRKIGEAIVATAAERDRLVAEALAGGDAAVAYERADERFRALYTEEQLAAYLAQHRGLLNPPRRSVSIKTQTTNNETVTSTRFETNRTHYVIYATTENDQYRLLGIGPDLDDAVPQAFVEDATVDRDDDETGPDLGLEI